MQNFQRSGLFPATLALGMGLTLTGCSLYPFSNQGSNPTQQSTLPPPQAAGMPTYGPYTAAGTPPIGGSPGTVNGGGVPPAGSNAIPGQVRPGAGYLPPAGQIAMNSGAWAQQGADIANVAGAIPGVGTYADFASSFGRGYAQEMARQQQAIVHSGAEGDGARWAGAIVGSFLAGVAAIAMRFQLKGATAAAPAATPAPQIVYVQPGQTIPPTTHTQVPAQGAA